MNQENGSELDVAEQRRFIHQKTLDRLTDAHVVLLRVLADPAGEMERRGQQVSIRSSVQATAKLVVGWDDDFYEMVAYDLVAAGLPPTPLYGAGG